ncbi:Pleckstrin homology domain-containing protein [Schizophyllum amplum]|uniref:Pleckstrin homology domain-containing protein n=1 Tax=Schizophyllum amplum TaxID=97359 RepID=A0A550CGL6_9AGAR|nr:Pleckstrin homology domain-containing protein [Auriculariopsis ampla]
MPDYDVSPVSPSEVLGRNGSDVEDTSAGATPDVQAIPTDYNGIVLRDRMLVRPSFLRDAALSAHFDEAENRTTRNMLHNDWKEYMVVWRRNHIELHEDYSTPGKEWLTGHKQLSFIIPIRRNKLNVTVYSFVDMTFCLSYANDPSSRSRQVLHLDKNGTNVFVFKVKTRSRAMDWYWALWRKLGGELPLLVEIRNPILDTRLKVELPDLSIMPIERAATIVSRDNLIALCMKSLRNADDFKSVVERALDKGDRLELAWRMDTNLDWIWLDEDVRGDPRYWAVLCGLALKQASRIPFSDTHLEIRLGRHYPEHLRTADGRRIDEPLSIEGYVDRIRPNTQLKHPVYLSTHDGFLFFVNQNVAQPPQPPGYVQLPPQDAYASILRRSEVRRGARQVMAAHAVCDLRSVVAVRRAFQVTGDRPHMKMRRSFELLLENGHVMRFEVSLFMTLRTHSCKNAIEWVTRLRALLLYWRMRKRNDAQEEMELARARRPLITPHLHPYHHDETDRAPEPPPDASAPLPALGSLFNWCVIDGCKPVIRAGRVFMRRGLNGPYKEVRLFLIAGHLVSFRMRRGTLVHRAMKRKLNLVDAYVVSGYFAALSLPRGQFSPGDESLPRRYQDGLESDDPEDDLLFMVWYRKQQPSLGPANISEEGVIEPPAVAVPANIPALSAKATVAVFRTRSKLERDAWCWSINCEMEKIVREQKEREERLRNTGSLKST